MSSKMEDGEQLVKDNLDASFHNSKAEKEEPSHQMDLQGAHKEFPHPQGIDFEKEQPSHLVAAHVENKGFTQSEDAQNLVDDSDQPVVKASASSKEGHMHEEQSLVEPSLVVDSTTVADTDINTNSFSGKNDGADMDSNVHPDSASVEERSLETEAEDETKEQFQDVVTTIQLPSNCGMVDEELNNGKLLQDNKTKEELKNGVTGTELTLDTEIIGEGSNEGLIGINSPPNNTRKEEVDYVPLHTETKEVLTDAITEMEVLADNETKEEILKHELVVEHAVDVKSSNKSFLLDPNAVGGDESGTEEEQAAFMKELESFHKERCLEFKPPRFYGEPLNCLKLWRAVIRLGGYEQVTSCKLWRQVGESFKPPKTCTTVSWTFRCFYEKALLEYEKHKMHGGELPFSDAPFTEPTSAGNQVGHNQASGSGRARRDAAARAMQGWHSQRLLGNGEVGDPIIKDKNSTFTPKREKQLKSIGLLKRKKSSPVERAVKVARLKASKPQLETVVVDIGAPADWVKINVQRTKDCFEVYALVPGLLREEVRVQSDPAGRLVISGLPEQLDNPWGVTPFKKVVSLPSRIDPHQTSAVVTLHGQLFVRVPFEQPDL